jgi:ABC-type branched-subunit amino acid transport system substrate-binding protein
LTPSQILDFFKEASTQNFKAKFFGASPLQSRTLVKQSEGRMDGALFVHNDVSSEFESEYIKQFGNDIQIPWAANTYDFVMLAGSLLNNFSQKPAAEEILNLLSKAQVANGAGGSYHYVDSEAVGKYFEYPIVVKAIRGDEFQLVYKNSTFK